ncbi:membrane-associated protein, putative [Bodo saltans]|uniref:Membrane-associated protein, putative n=1 Tax=Bodo saltans TaxID=75058 RepID=A0A0S4KDW4_BODSA|nr:membrane-associated protein, putative [Bodo saltans]|eukprot:CUI11647.1 membrane-associated protein, putative [Bodo saltans]
MRGIEDVRRKVSLLLRMQLLLSWWYIACCGSRLAVLTETTTPYTTYSSLGAMPDGTSTTGGLVYVSTRGNGVYRISGSSGAVTLVAGSGSLSGYGDGYGGSAKFFYPCGIVGNANGKIAYVTDRDNFRIRAVDLVTGYASTLAGSGVKGAADGVGTSAQFDRSYQIAFHAASGGVLYVSDSDSQRIRKIVLSTVSVTTILAFAGGVTVTNDGAFLYCSGATSIIRMNAVTRTTVTIAGGSVAGIADGVGTAARFYNVYSTVLTPGETGLIVMDSLNRRIRYVDLETMRVSTIAGSGAIGFINGLNLKSGFLCPFASFWHCLTPTKCGVLVSDEVDQGGSALRFVHITVITLTQSNTPTEETTATASMLWTRTPSITPSGEPASSSVTRSSTASPQRSASVTLAESTTVTAATDVATMTSTAGETSTVSISASKATKTLSSVNITLSGSLTITCTKPASSYSQSPPITSSQLTTLSRTGKTNTHRTIPKPSWTITDSTTQWRCHADERAQVTVLLSNHVLPALSASRKPTVTIGMSSVIPAIKVNQTSTALPSTTIATQPVQREVLMGAPLFLVNVTLAASPTAPVLHWTVWNVSTRGFPLLWAYNKSFDAAWHWLCVEPPSDSEGGWLGRNAPLMLDRIVEIEIVMACGGEPGLTLVLRVVAPRYTSEFAENVALAAQISQILSIVSGSSSSGSALGRALATKSMVICDVDTAMDNGVMDFNFIVCPSDALMSDNGAIFESATPAAIPARSALLSNLIVIGTAAVLLMLAGACWAVLQNTSLRFGLLRVMCLPSSLLPVWTAALPSLASSFAVLTAQIASNDHLCLPSDVAMVVAGVVFSLAPASAILALWHRKISAKVTGGASPPIFWECVAIPERPVPPKQRRYAFQRLKLLLIRITRRSWKWGNFTTNTSGELTQPSPLLPTSIALRAAFVLLTDFRLLWYAGAVDQAVLVAVSILSVVSGLDNTNRALCIGCTATVVGLLLAQFVVVARCSPFTSLLSFVFGLVTVLLTCLGVFAQLMFISTSSSSLAGLWMVQASVACTLAVVGLSAMKMLFDASEVLAAVTRRISVVCGCSFGRHSLFQEPGQGKINSEATDVVLMDDCVVSPITSVVMDPPPSVNERDLHVELETLDDDDWWRSGRGLEKLFWKDDGTAKTETKRGIGLSCLRDDAEGDADTMPSTFFHEWQRVRGSL